MTKPDLMPILRFMQQLPKSGDVELMLLKSHLLVEEALTKLIAGHAKHPEHLRKARLTFAQKMNLARALCDLKNGDWIWKPIEKLNEARNALSHGLDEEHITSKVKAFITCVDDASKHQDIKMEFSGKFGPLHWAAYRVFIVVAVHADFDPSRLKIPTLLSDAAEEKKQLL